MKRVVIFLVFFVVVAVKPLIAQVNFVPNGSFEQYEINKRKKSIVKFWKSANPPCITYYNTKGNSLSYNGKGYPYSGNGFVELRATKSISYGYYGSLQIKLSKTLVKDKRYLLKTHIKRTALCDCYYSTKSCRFILSDSSFYFNDKYYFESPSVLVYKCDSSFIDTAWTMIYSKYIANGTENFLTIGINWDDKESKKCVCGQGKACYQNDEHGMPIPSYLFFIDDVSITEIDDTVKIKCEEKPLTKFIKDAVLVLPNINFFTNSDSLTKSSYAELEKLLTELKKNPNLEIEISGHTDDVGNKEKNLSLSDARAKAVKRYLVSKGIKDSRIQTKGEGYNRPLIKATDELSRAKNRRVEVKVLKN